MGFQRFEDLPAWRAEIDLAFAVFQLSSSGRLLPDGGVRDPMERAVVSVSNRIAEGEERGTTDELLAFLDDDSPSGAAQHQAHRPE